MVSVGRLALATLSLVLVGVTRVDATPTSRPTETGHAISNNSPTPSPTESLLVRQLQAPYPTPSPTPKGSGWWSGWSLKKELDSNDILKLLVGIGIAIYFKKILQRRFEYEANLRDLLLKRLEVSEKRLARIESACQDLKVGDMISPELQAKLVPLFKALAIAIGHLEKALLIGKFGPARKQLQAFIQGMRSYKQFLTGRAPAVALDAADLGRCEKLHSDLATILTTVSIQVLENRKEHWYSRR